MREVSSVTQIDNPWLEQGMREKGPSSSTERKFEPGPIKCKCYFVECEGARISFQTQNNN